MKLSLQLFPYACAFGLLAILPVSPARGEPPAERWNLRGYSEGKSVTGSAGTVLNPAGSVVGNEDVADFTGGGSLSGSAQVIAPVFEGPFSIVCKVRLLSTPVQYATIFDSSPGMIRMMGRRLEAACDGEWHAIGAERSDAMMDNWSTVALTWDGSVYRLYLNAQLVGEHAANGLPKKGLEIGVGGRVPGAAKSGEPDNRESFSGLIEFADVYSSALTPEDLKAIK